jgi:kynureninase
VKAWDEWLPEIDRAAGRVERLLSAPKGTVVPGSNVSAIQALVASCFDWSAADGKNRIVYSSLEFPSVSYVWQAETRRGAEVTLVPSEDGVTIDTEAMCAAIDERTALVPLSHVAFGTSHLVDVQAICDKARSVGAHVLLNLYQALGVVPVDIVDLGVSFACGGFSTFLCGGPGAAYLYVRKDLIEAFEPRVTGWLANDAPFAYSMPEQAYAESIWRYMGGTPDIAALYQSRGGAEIVREVGVGRIRENSLRQTQLAMDVIEALGFQLKSPREPDRRGASVVFDFVGAAEVARELDRRRFFCDYRPGLGICISPHFYNTDDELLLFFEELSQVLG